MSKATRMSSALRPAMGRASGPALPVASKTPATTGQTQKSLCLLRALSERVLVWHRLWAPLGDVDVHQPEVRSALSSYPRSVLRLLRGRPTFVCSLCSNA